MEPKEWHREIGDESFVVSTSPALLSHEFINASFAEPAMYWARPFSPENLKTMLDNSCMLGLYLKSPSSAAAPQSLTDDAAATHPQPAVLTQIGMARLVTDYVTSAYLSDVFVRPEHQGKGLGKWIIQCVKEMTDAMPELRRVMFMAKNEPHAIRFYEELLGARVHDQKGKVAFMSTFAPLVD